MALTKRFEETINITVELEPSLRHFVDPEGKASRVFSKQLLQFLNDLLTDLTIPAKIVLEISQANDTKSLTTSYQVTINNQKCRLPIPSLEPQDVEASKLASSIAKRICQNPEIFLTTPMAEKIKESWQSNSVVDILDSITPEDFKSLLVEFVRRYLKIERLRMLPQILEKWCTKEETPIWDTRRIFEKCISDWSALRLKIFLSDDCPFYSIDTKMQPKIDDRLIEKFELMRDGLFYELGVMAPKVSVEVDKSLERGDFRIQLNDVRLPPARGLRQGTFMVNDTADRLGLLNISAESIINPANQSECAVVRDEEGNIETCKEAGLTTWKPDEFIVLALSAEFRKNAAAFINEMVVGYNLKQLRRAFPDLIDASEERFDNTELAIILRELLEEDFSIRNLRDILETLLAIHLSSYPIISATPNPVGVGQKTLLAVGITQQQVIATDGWEGPTVTVETPDGMTETLGPFRTDSTGLTGTVYVPTMVGSYILQTNCPKQKYKSITYEASTSKKLTLVVQKEPVKMLHDPDCALELSETYDGAINLRIDRNKTVQSIRIASKQYISAKHVTYGKNLVVLLLNPEIEQKIMNDENQFFLIGNKDHEELVKAIGNEMRYSTNSSKALILTNLEVRRKLKKLIEKEFPELRILCYQEISPDFNVCPIGQVSMYEEEVTGHD